MEFVQFHPTALLSKENPLFLLSEALRGAGALLVDERGSAIGDPLLPRDVVSRMVFFAQKKSPVFLDLRHRPLHFWQEHFPRICAHMLQTKHVSSGQYLDPEKDLIPLTPAAHFFCGGVATDCFGKTTIPRLFALGEVAESGIHGANRLASNSLLEGVAMAHVLRDYFFPLFPQKNLSPFPLPEIPHFFPEVIADAVLRRELQDLLFHSFGIVRSPLDMHEAGKRLQTFVAQGTETKNMLLVAKALSDGAQARKKSSGAHFLIS